VFRAERWSWYRQATLIAADGATKRLFRPVRLGGWDHGGGWGRLGTSRLPVMFRAMDRGTCSRVDPSGAGISVSVSGDTAVLSGGNAGGGQAYVFERSGGVWTEQQELTASDEVTATDLAIPCR